MSEESIEIVPYSPGWPVAFRAEAVLLISALRDPSFLIEHVGSTAVPGLGGKPVVDIMLGATNLAAVDARRPAIEALDYDYGPPAEAVIRDRRFFVKCVGGRRAFHLHAVQAGSSSWIEHLVFRDRLRGDPELAAYHEVKAGLARQFRDDREAYTSGKSAFILQVLGRAGGRLGGDEGAPGRPT
ncbi:MAG: hypothetical protein AUI47_08205 [Acidobacteria bacterium 13_1_40CM_2_68_5]|nr:MAG: hypothetical protein AUI47_08205 [Acidobacteria bacterium 13_1_40CM_2_68_5]